MTIVGHRSNPASFRVATYNVRACVGIDRRRSEARIAEVIAELSADIVGLQELDLRRPRSARVDQAGLIAGHLGWHHYFHVAMQYEDGGYGDAILSRWPITMRHAGELVARAPSYCRETRAAAWVDVQTDIGSVNVINTHFGLGRRERLTQARLLTSAAWLGAIDCHSPIVLLGDLNSRPGSAPHRVLAKHLRDVRTLVAPTRRAFPTYPTRFPLLALDHIFVNEALGVANVWVHRTALARIASDHFPLVADLVRQPRSAG